MSIEEPPSAVPAGNHTPASSDASFIGVDLGGTKVSIAVMRGGKLEPPQVVPTDCSSQQALIEQLVSGIERAMGSCEGRPLAVGVGIPSVIEFQSARVRSSVNIPLADVALGDLLSERLGGIDVFIDNDATCAALAEAHDESGRLDVKHLVMLTVGTGVGGGIIIDGRPYRGATGAAGELGHMIIGLDLSERVCSSPDFPQNGSLEILASGRALDELARQIVSRHPDSALARAHAGGRDLAGPDVVASARDGDEQSRAAVALLGQRLGVGIANVINIFDPEVVAIAGGVSAANDLLLDHARQSAWSFVLPGVGQSTEIRLARSGAHAGVRGAALLASQEWTHNHHEGY